MSDYLIVVRLFGAFFISNNGVNDMSSSSVGNAKSIESFREVYEIIVIRAGPVGQHFVKEIFRLDASKRVKWFGDESYQPYDRVSLTPLLSGKIGYDDVFIHAKVEHLNLKKVFNTSIVGIDRTDKSVIDAYGCKHYFEKLVLATGSSPHIPDIPGVKANRVYRFRDLNDVCELQARTASVLMSM